MKREELEDTDTNTGISYSTSVSAQDFISKCMNSYIIMKTSSSYNARLKPPTISVLSQSMQLFYFIQDF